MEAEPGAPRQKTGAIGKPSSRPSSKQGLSDLDGSDLLELGSEIDSEFALDDFIAAYAEPLKERVSLHSKKKKVMIISGPTAVGKSRVALMVAKAISGEIISADSVQVYKGMDIGTAKVSSVERCEVAHHLIDMHELHEPFNIMNFYRETAKLIAEILARGNVPIIVGGTGFYINSLLYGPPMAPPSTPDVREAIEREMEVLGPEALYKRLAELDPEYAASVTGSDKQKIVRALEIMRLSGQKVSLFAQSSSSAGLCNQYNFRCWFLHMPREYLNTEIEKRCDKMLADGLVEEVQELKRRGLEANRSAAQAIGYRQTLLYLESDRSACARSLLASSFKKASREYAKRQFTWFRNKDRDKLFQWINVLGISPAEIADYLISDYELSL